MWYYWLMLLVCVPNYVSYWFVFIFTHASIQEEMARHAPLYGAGLDQLSSQELDTLLRIHDEGLRQVSACRTFKINELARNGVQDGGGV